MGLDGRPFGTGGARRFTPSRDSPLCYPPRTAVPCVAYSRAWKQTRHSGRRDFHGHAPADASCAGGPVHTLSTPAGGRGVPKNAKTNIRLVPVAPRFLVAVAPQRGGFARGLSSHLSTLYPPHKRKGPAVPAPWWLGLVRSLCAWWQFSGASPRLGAFVARNGPPDRFVRLRRTAPQSGPSLALRAFIAFAGPPDLLIRGPVGPRTTLHPPR